MNVFLMFIYLLTHACVHMCVCVCVCVCVVESEDNLGESILSLNVGSKDRTQVLSLDTSILVYPAIVSPAYLSRIQEHIVGQDCQRDYGNAVLSLAILCI